MSRLIADPSDAVLLLVYILAALVGALGLLWLAAWLLDWWDAR